MHQELTCLNGLAHYLQNQLPVRHFDRCVTFPRASHCWNSSHEMPPGRILSRAAPAVPSKPQNPPGPISPLGGLRTNPVDLFF